MKIPQILAQEPVAVPQAPRAPGVNDSGMAVFGKGLAEVGSALGILARAEDAKREQFGRDEAARAAAEAELDVKTFLADLDVTERDPDRYRQRFEEHLQKTTERVSAGLTTDEGRAAFARKMTPALTDWQVAARKGANQRYLDRGTATLDTTTDVKTRLIGGIPFGDDATFTRHLRDGFDAIVGATPWLGEEEAGKRRRAFRDKAWGAYAQAAIDAGQFRADDPRWAGMEPGQFETIRRHAETVERQQRADRERVDKAMEKDFEEAKKALILDLDREAAGGTLTEAQLDLRVNLRQIDPEDARRIRKAIREGPDERASDRATLTHVMLDVHGTNPTYTEADINALQKAGRLNLKDAIAAKDRLRQETDATLKSAHEQGERELRAAVGMPPGLVAAALGDNPTARLYLAALQEYRRRSRYFKGGKEDPLAVAADLAPRLTAAAGAGATLKLKELRALRRFPTMEALEAARPMLGEDEYHAQRRMFLEVERLEREQATPAKPAAPGASGARPRL